MMKIGKVTQIDLSRVHGAGICYARRAAHVAIQPDNCHLSSSFLYWVYAINWWPEWDTPDFGTAIGLLS